MNGILIVNKDKDFTSRDVVNKVSNILHIKKIGHTGTLDPIATGVLVLCIGKCTKLVNFLTSKDKEYIAEFKLGIETDTLDITGNILKEEKVNVSKEDIENVINTFPKEYDQEVPKYSAVKINGKKLYQYARANEVVSLPKRKVEIKEMELLSIDNNIVKIRAKVSKGTYIRSLIKDIATNSNTIASMTSLVRTKQGNFSLDEACSLKDIENNNYKLLTIDEVFSDYEKREIDNELAQKIKNGILIPYDFKDYILLTNNNEVIAVYQHYNDEFAKPLIIF